MRDTRRLQLQGMYYEFIEEHFPKGTKILTKEDYPYIHVNVKESWKKTGGYLSSSHITSSDRDFVKITLRELEPDINFGDDKYDEPKLTFSNCQIGEIVEDFDTYLHETIDIIYAPYWTLNQNTGGKYRANFGFNQTFDRVIIQLPEGSESSMTFKAYTPEKLIPGEVYDTNFKRLMGTL